MHCSARMWYIKPATAAQMCASFQCPYCSSCSCSGSSRPSTSHSAVVITRCELQSAHAYHQSLQLLNVFLSIENFHIPCEGWATTVTLTYPDLILTAQCGCECLSCCDLVPDVNGTSFPPKCRVATAGAPCLPGSYTGECRSYNDSNCGPMYSNSRNIQFCGIAEPSTWPPISQVWDLPQGTPLNE